MFPLSNNDWSNHSILHRNRLPARAHFIPGPTPEQALASPTASSRAILLNGEWDFTWFQSPLLVSRELIKSPVTGERTIPVPLNWQFAGYGNMHYTDMDYPFPVDPPHIPAKNETGVYKRAFTLQGCGSDRFFLRFEGVESAFHLYVNGQSVGYSQGSRMPSEFEVTRLVQDGENQLCAVVYQYCDGSYLEAQDMWWLGGIIRDVVLLRRPQVYVQDLVLDPDYDIVKKAGILNLRPRISDDTARLEIAVYDNTTLMVREESIPQEGLRLAVPGVVPWNAEQPHLYYVVATLYSEEGAALESICLPTGFRHLEIVEGQLRLNGQRLFMKGYNRHELHPERGRVVTRDDTRRDLLRIKAAGLNAVRCSHYPNNSFFYQLCDELGLYVIDECDLETDGLNPVGQLDRLAADKSWQNSYLDRIERMVGRDRNFACVVMWSLANESGYGENFAAMYRWCKENEPTRPVHYEGDFKNQSVDVSSSMYTSIGDLAELDLDNAPLRPHILCEFGHGMGNGPGSLGDYFDLAYNSRRIQGIFVWEYMDHGVYSDRGGVNTWFYGGDFGEKYHNGNFCLDGYIAANGVPSTAFYEFQAAAANVRVTGFDVAAMQARVQNRWSFMLLDAARLEYSFIAGEECIGQGSVRLPAAKPGETAMVSIPDGMPAGDSPLWLDMRLLLETDTAAQAAGDVVGYHRVLLREAASAPFRLVSGWAAREIAGGLLVEGSNFAIQISTIDGWIDNYTVGGLQLMSQGPRLNLFRAYTDNDAKDRPEWEKNHLSSLCYTVRRLVWEQEAECLLVKAELYAAPGALAWGVLLDVRYRIGGDGSVVMDIQGRFTGKDIPQCLPKIGTQALLNKEASEILYRGFGPGENYRDSLCAARDGIWRSAPQNLGVRYLRPQENGNRSGTRWVAVQAGENTLAIASDTLLDFSLRAFTDDMLVETAHDAELTESEHWVMNLDYKNAGLGSASCGPRPLKHHRVYPLPFAWRMAFVPAQGGRAAQIAQRAMGLLQSMREE